ncbi:Uncharacterized protein HZ326_31394 [Fusarium oxysporum f. sp. albedinis]|nr:Uncharacterized protein HZ326_31394 [Fusarium oxysporum f. sp. albedinis]
MTRPSIHFKHIQCDTSTSPEALTGKAFRFSFAIASVLDLQEQFPGESPKPGLSSRLGAHDDQGPNKLSFSHLDPRHSSRSSPKKTLYWSCLHLMPQFSRAVPVAPWPRCRSLRNRSQEENKLSRNTWYVDFGSKLTKATTTA